MGDEKLADAFRRFQEANFINESNEKPIEITDKYMICDLKTKKRYVNPLVLVNGKAIRIKDYSNKVQRIIEKFLNFETKKYAWIDI